MASSTTWVMAVTHNATARAIAQKINRSHSSVASWLRRDVFPADVVLQIAAAYQADPMEGLIAAGHLHRSELHFRDTLRLIPTTMLTEELHRRSAAFDAARAAGRPWKPPHRTDPIPTTMPD